MKKLLLKLFAFINLASNATTYYIDPTGNDATGNGTIGNPWKTLYKATSTVNAVGDIIHVSAGNYNETQQSILSVGVSIEGDGPTSVIKSIYSQVFNALLFLPSPEGTNGNQHISNLKFDGNNLNGFWGILVSGRSNVSIYNCRIIDFQDVGVIFRGKNNPTDGPPSIYAIGNSFHDNYVSNCAIDDGVYGRGNLQIGGQEGILIYNDSIIQTGRTTGANGYCIKNNNQGFLKGVKIYNCYLEVPPYPYIANGVNNHWDFATEFSDVSGLEVYNNTIFGSCDQNFQTKGNYAFSVSYHDNVFGRNTVQLNPESGIILEYGTEEGLVYNNTFKNVAFPITFSLRATSSVNGMKIYKNLMYGIGVTGSNNSGQAVRFIDDGSYSYIVRNYSFHNNTVLGFATHMPFWGIDVPGGANAKNISIINNIIKDFQAGDIHIYDANTIDTLIVRNNNVSSSGIFLNGTATHYTNTANTTVNPNLNSLYQPNVGSPMIDAGVNVGLPYNGSAPDIGYFETGIATKINKSSISTMSIYPNPTNDMINIDLNAIYSNEASIEIYDMLGHLVMNKNIPNRINPINTSSLSKGIYILKITSNANSFIKSFIKE